jgi:two-component system chemotaxis family response regulator WspR
MRTLIVDDAAEIRRLIRTFLQKGGFGDVSEAATAEEALGYLGLDGQVSPAGSPVDLILMDVHLPGMTGIEACRRIKAHESLRDLPVVMVTVSNDMACLQASFEAGAVDYLTKPISRIELLARLRSIRTLKEEMDRRKERERELLKVKAELEAANSELQRLSSLDALTGIPNRRRFDEVLAQEWARAQRNGSPLSIALTDIDYFKAYNDAYGHQSGDSCLVAVAGAMKGAAKREIDLIARYGGEEFAAVLPELPSDGAAHVASAFNSAVANLRILHRASRVCHFVTVSVGVATAVPSRSMTASQLLSQADVALYYAKAAGRNGVTHFRDIEAGDGSVSVSGLGLYSTPQG